MVANETLLKHCLKGTFAKQWLWLSWQSDPLLYQRSTVRILLLAKFYNEHMHC